MAVPIYAHAASTHSSLQTSACSARARAAAPAATAAPGRKAAKRQSHGSCLEAKLQPADSHPETHLSAVGSHMAAKYTLVPTAMMPRHQNMQPKAGTKASDRGSKSMEVFHWVSRQPETKNKTANVSTHVARAQMATPGGQATPCSSNTLQPEEQ